MHNHPQSHSTASFQGQRDYPVDAYDRPRVSIRRYIDPAQYEKEQRKLFTNTWRLAFRWDAIANPGDYHVHDVGEYSLLFVRGQDNVVRCFKNTCTHRGCPIASAQGNASRFVCPYHAWTFNLQGKLIAVPEKGMFVDLDMDRLALAPVSVVEWAGIIWFNLSPSPEPFEDIFGEIDSQLKIFDLERQATLATRSWTVGANWKLLIDNFNESYHNQFVHTNTSNSFVDWRRAQFRAVSVHSGS